MALFMCCPANDDRRANRLACVRAREWQPSESLYQLLGHVSRSPSRARPVLRGLGSRPSRIAEGVRRSLRSPHTWPDRFAVAAQARLSRLDRAGPSSAPAVRLHLRTRLHTCTGTCLPALQGIRLPDTCDPPTRRREYLNQSCGGCGQAPSAPPSPKPIAALDA